MLKKLRHSIKRDGFTLIELLAVIAIIALLVGVLVPGMKNFKNHAKRLKQKSNIRNAEIGLELFYKVFKRYPISKSVNVFGASNKVVCGAQHLTEALVGRDERGFDLESEWHEFDESSLGLYDSDETTPGGLRSINRRKNPFIELRDTGAFLLEQIYDAAALSGASLAGKTLLSGDSATVATDGSKRAPVLTDVFGTRRPGVDGKVGTPIVCFIASTKYSKHKEVPQVVPPADDVKKWRYNYYDNALIFKLPHIKDPTIQHRYNPDYIDPKTGETGKQLFYKAITNQNSNYEKPYNPNTYIIISAGTDGIFGTKDDVTNF
jgi:prepilin-type N-terminal cleavage/methylation domain-containing protein